MQLRDIIVVADQSEIGKARVEYAAKLARQSNGRLTGIGFVPPVLSETMLLGNEWGPAGLSQLGPTAELDLHNLHEEARHGNTVQWSITNSEHIFRTASEGLATEWILSEYGDPSKVIQLSQLADLTILGQHPSYGEGEDGGFHPEDVILASGGPCLVIPYAGIFETIGKRVLVAWDGGIEAARALRSAKPFLMDAAWVTIIGVYSNESALDEMRMSLEHVESRLRLQGIKAFSEPCIQGNLKISDILLNRAADLTADLLVTGSFHHSRLREQILGGVSRELLTHMTLPVLMSH